MPTNSLFQPQPSNDCGVLMAILVAAKNNLYDSCHCSEIISHRHREWTKRSLSSCKVNTYIIYVCRLTSVRETRRQCGQYLSISRIVSTSQPCRQQIYRKETGIGRTIAFSFFLERGQFHASIAQCILYFSYHFVA